MLCEQWLGKARVGLSLIGHVMIDPKIFRKNLPLVLKSCERRGFDFDVAKYQELEARRKKLQVELETLRASKKEFSRRVAKMSPQEREAYVRDRA